MALGPLQITGLGTLNALGLTKAAYWQQLLDGARGPASIAGNTGAGATVHLGAEVKGFDPRVYMPVRFYRRLSRLSRLAVAAGSEALTDSGILVTDANRERLGV